MPKHTIVIVDDNTQAADSMSRLLEALGYSVRARYSGEETLKHIDKDSPDLMLVDIGMPGMDGYELIEALRTNKKTSIPIVALTGYGQLDDKERARKAGFTKHLTKPVGVSELRTVLSLIAP